MAEIKMLAIDLGASSGRGIIGRYDGKKLVLEENHRFPNEPVMMNGYFSWDIQRIFHEIKNSIRKCALSDDKDIQSIGIDTWGVDYGLIDKKGRLLATPMHYRDARNLQNISYAEKFMTGEKLYNATGIQFINFNTIYQLMAEMRDHPELLNVADKMLFIPDLLNYFLTGIQKTEYSIASTGAILDSVSRNWSWDVIESFGIPKHLFTEIVEPGATVGMLSRDVLEDVGAIHAKVVNVASHDTASAVAAVPALEEGFAYISSGTWSLMGTELKQPKIDSETRKLNFSNEGGICGTYRFLKNIMGLWLEQESRRQWKREGKEISFNELSDAAMASKPLACIIDPDAPEFMAPGDMPGRIAEYCRKTGQYVPQTYGEIVRCIFDSLALKYKWTIDKMQQLTGQKFPALHIVGGGTKEEPLCQLAADACGIDVYAGPVEATAAGNILGQLIALGEIKDVFEGREIIRNSFEIKYYEPKKNIDWASGYEKLISLIEN